MQERVNRSSISFRYPFTLAGEERPQPAGIYEIETVEEPIPGLSFLAYRRISTTITLPGPGLLTRQLLEIHPADLAAALARDAEADHAQP
jgi:hypothetical protein